MRSAGEDLEVYKKVSDVPWRYEHEIIDVTSIFTGQVTEEEYHTVKRGNKVLLRLQGKDAEAIARFIAMSWEALPYWVNRAEDFKEALQDLYDEQNGAPLLTREKQWEETMKRAEFLLSDKETSRAE